MTDIVKMGTQLFQDKLGDQAENLDNDSVTDALSGLLSNEEGGLDLGNIISSVTNSEGGLGSIVSSWLGDGENAAIDPSQLTELLGSDQISSFAEKLGVDSDTALSGLSEAIPNIIDKSSEGGSLVGSLLGSVMDSTEGSAGGIMGLIGKIFGK
ncbi:MAG: YidB family protein [Epsilonproteobacteria bacterium]|nr:YidB family protein [Campylobacterota bacterium]